MTRQNFLNWIKIAGIGLVAFLCVCWLPAIKSLVNTCWSELIWMYAVTFAVLNARKAASSSISVVSALLSGALLLPVIVICCCEDTGMSIIFLISMIIGAVLAAVCHAYKKSIVFILSAALVILYNSFVVPLWESLMLY